MNILVEQDIELHLYDICQSETDIVRLIPPDFSEVGLSGNSYDFASSVEMMKAEESSNFRIHSEGYEYI